MRRNTIKESGQDWFIWVISNATPELTLLIHRLPEWNLVPYNPKSDREINQIELDFTYWLMREIPDFLSKNRLEVGYIMKTPLLC